MNKAKFIVVFSLLLLSAASYAAVVWDGTSAAWTKGSGTEADPYLIETPQHLAYLAKQVNAGNTYAGMYFKQTDDFDLAGRTWTAIGKWTYNGTTSTNKAFKGTYDGNQKVFRNTSKCYLFYYVYDTTVKKLYLEGKNVSLIAVAESNYLVSNCHSSVVFDQKNSVVSNSYNFEYFAAFISYSIRTSAKTQVIEKCSFSGSANLSGRWSVFCDFGGGKLLYCGNTGNINATTTYGLGDVSECFACYNTGDISVSGSGDIVSSSEVVNYFYNTGNTGRLVVNYAPNGCISCYSTNYRGDNTTGYTFNSRRAYNCYDGHAYNNMTLNPGVTYTPAEMMKTQDFVDKLNSVGDMYVMDYLGINDGYPIFKWQLEGMTLYKLRATCQEVQGTVSGSGEYPASANVTIKATPKDGFVFTGWNDRNTDNPRIVTVTGDATYVAQFSQSAYTIYVNQDCTTSVE